MRRFKSVAQALASGSEEYVALEEDALAALRQAGFEPDYVSIRRAETLDAPDRDSDELVVLAAATLGNARLIDNVVVAV